MIPGSRRSWIRCSAIRRRTADTPAANGQTLEDRRAVAEMAACLIAYNLSADGLVVPRSCYKGFEEYSFGQKKRPSPFATARVAVILGRFNDLAEEIRSVDVLGLGSSRGGTGIPVPPKR